MGRKDIAKAVLLVLALAALFVGITWAATLLTDVSFKDSATIVQAIGTTVAIAAGGVFAFQRLQLFRTFEPHLTISHQVSYRPIGESYVHISVTATLYNSSRVKIEIRKGFFLLQQIAPVPDEEIEHLYSQLFEDREQNNLQWPTLDEFERDWDRGELIVEPGESHPETFEFIVSTEVDSVTIYTYFHNSRFSQRAQAAEGWGATTVFDIMYRESRSTG